MAESLINLIADLKEVETVEYIESALGRGEDPDSLLKVAKEAMVIIGDRYASGEYFIPDLVFSGEILKAVIKLLEPGLKQNRSGSLAKTGKVIIGTVEGDIHDIGKDIVVSMLDVSGFEVIDLGIDVSAEKFIEAIRLNNAKVVALSGFLTMSFDSMKVIIDQFKSEGLRNSINVMIGGGLLDDEIREYTGADAYGKDAMDAVKLANQWLTV